MKWMHEVLQIALERMPTPLTDEEYTAGQSERGGVDDNDNNVAGSTASLSRH